MAAGPAASAEEARWFQALTKGDALSGEDAKQWRRLDLSPRQLDVIADLAAQGIGDPDYERVLSYTDRRIDNLSLHRGLH